MAFRKDVDIANSIFKDYFNSNHTLNIERDNLSIAFGVERYFNGTALDDADFVEWVVSIEEKVGLKETSRPVNFHKCNDSDFDNFYPIIEK